MAEERIVKQRISVQKRLLVLGILAQLEAELADELSDLSSEQRQRYGSINEQNKLLVAKVLSYFKNQPQHSAPEVNWQAFVEDYECREFWEAIILRLQSLVHQAQSTKIFHDHDNYYDALDDYDYAQYRAARGIAGAIEKEAELKQFFPRTSRRDSPE